jgi:stress response protein YsnF
MTIVIGVYDDSARIEPVRQALGKLGCRDEAITVHRDSGDAEALERLGFEGHEIDELRAELDQGRIVITARVADDKADRAIDVLREHGSLPAGQEEDQEEDQGDTAERRTVREVAEEVSVGKRAVTRGVRVRTNVVEQPVRETVALRQEKVQVERRDRNEELTPEEAEKALKPEVVEMQETVEEAEVSKAARLIGEVNVSKTVETQRETIHDTARRTEAEVERTEGREQTRR